LEKCRGDLLSSRRHEIGRYQVSNGHGPRSQPAPKEEKTIRTGGTDEALLNRYLVPHGVDGVSEKEFALKKKLKCSEENKKRTVVIRRGMQEKKNNGSKLRSKKSFHVPAKPGTDRLKDRGVGNNLKGENGTLKKTGETRLSDNRVGAVGQPQDCRRVRHRES